MIRFICILFVVLTLFSFDTFSEETVRVRLDNDFIYSDVPPLLIDGRTYLPLRAILNAIGVDN